MAISRPLAMAAALTLAAGAATSALASGANAPVRSPSDLPTGGATYGVTDWTSQFNSVSGSGAGFVTLGGANASAAPAFEEAFVSGAIGAGTPETQLAASSEIKVNFYINGPTGALAPIILQGEVTGSRSGNGLLSGGAFLESYGDDGRDAVSLISFSNCNFTTPCGGAFDQTFNLPTGVIFSVLLEIGGRILNNPTDSVSGPGAFSGEADPPDLISIDPNFAAQNPGFSLAINSGAAPAPGVPEPASWALMIAGFGLAGAGLRRRKVSIA